jgi:NADH-quinone oxidoreductase subunit G
MNIFVCVGSSCHLRGSAKIVELLKNAVQTNKLEDKVTLSGSFCLGKCTEGVSIKVDDQIVCGVSPENFDEIFKKYVLDQL